MGNLGFGVDHTLWRLPAWGMDSMDFQDESFHSSLDQMQPIFLFPGTPGSEWKPELGVQSLTVCHSHPGPHSIVGRT